MSGWRVPLRRRAPVSSPRCRPNACCLSWRGPPALDCDTPVGQGNDMTRCMILAIVLALAACNRDSMTRDFGVSRDAGPSTTAGGLPPLSTPPGLANHPEVSPLLQPQQEQAAAATPPSEG